MKTKRNRVLFIIAGVILAASLIFMIVMLCTRQRPDKPDIQETETTEQTAAEVQEETALVLIEEDTTEGDTAPSYPVVELEVPPIEKQETTIRLEAENAVYTGLLAVETLLPGYSGEGYLAGFNCNVGDSVKANCLIPAAQHYDITISVCANTEVTNTLMVNGVPAGAFTISERGNFVRVTFSGIYLPQGEVELSIQEQDGGFSLDYFEISDYTEMYQMEYNDTYELSDKDASDAAKALMAFMSEQYGEKVITGQYAATDANHEIDLLYQLTGKTPAIRFADLAGCTKNSKPVKGDAVQASIDWAKRGGIVGLIWHWDAPMGISSVYAKETDFSLKAAVTTEEVAWMTQEEIDSLYEAGEITEECYAILRDIDSAAARLKPLAQADIPVLWRPLHEAGGDWFWWGSDGAIAYRWLWELMYHRMTEYHELHNLIWIWNGQREAYRVDETLYDIASLDIYLEPEANYSSRYEQYVLLSRMTEGKKLLALSETSSIPSMNDMFRDNCIWSFFGLWYGEYLMDEQGAYSEAYTASEDMIAFYNSEAAITLTDSRAFFLERQEQSGQTDKPEETKAPETTASPETTEPTEDTTESTTTET